MFKADKWEICRPTPPFVLFVLVLPWTNLATEKRKPAIPSETKRAAAHLVQAEAKSVEMFTPCESLQGRYRNVWFIRTHRGLIPTDFILFAQANLSSGGIRQEISLIILKTTEGKREVKEKSFEMGSNRSEKQKSSQTPKHVKLAFVQENGEYLEKRRKKLQREDWFNQK